MSRTIDWTELKNEDIFVVENPSTLWMNQTGVYSSRPDRPLRFRDNRIYDMMNDKYSITGDIFLRDYSSRHFPRQPVTILEESEIPKEAYFYSLGPRANAYTGSDPEIFVVRGKERKSLLPAFRYLPTHEDAKKQKDFARQKAVLGSINTMCTSYAYRDGFAAECYIHPVHCHGYLINYLRDGLSHVLSAARTFDRTSELTIKNTFTIPQTTMDSGEDGDVAFGCNPSLNAYGDVPGPPPAPRELRVRFAGGHVHFDINGLTDAVAAEMVKSADITAAIPAVAIFASLDTPARRQFYGRAGEYRKPEHGLEYRVLSNAWLCAPEVSHLILNLTRVGLKVGKAGFRKYFEIDEEKVRDIINYCDVKAAREYVVKHIKKFDTLLATDGSHAGMKAFRKIIEEGVEGILPDYNKVESNWKLGGSWLGESNNHTATWGYLCRGIK